MTKKPPEPPKLRAISLLLIALFLSTAANLTNITAANAQGYALNLGLNLLSRATGVRIMPSGMSSGMSGTGGNSANYNAAVGCYNRGIKMLNAERYGEATALFEQVGKIYPQMPGLYGCLGACRLEAGRNQEAMQCFLIAESQGDRSENVAYKKGLCAIRLANYTVARDSFRQYLANNSHGRHAKHAQECLAIVEHNFLNQSNDNYLADASKDGVKRWNTNGKPILVYIKADPSLKGFHPEYVQLVQQSFMDWSNGTNGAISFVQTQDPSQAQITCYWTDNQADFDSSKELGECQNTLASGYINHSEIKLSTLVGHARDIATEVFPEAKAVALHEIGHALGLAHSSTSFDIMYPTAAPKGLEFNLTKRDLNTAVALYSINPEQIASASESQIQAFAANGFK